jgi:hypothetical protein
MRPDARFNLANQNRERTGVPKRAARLGWWMRPGVGFNLADGPWMNCHRSHVSGSTWSLPLPVLIECRIQ